MKRLPLLGLLGLAMLSFSCARERPAGPPENAVLAIEGLHCEGCVKSITHAVSALKGVDEITVSLAENRASVTYRPDRVELSRIVATIEGLGYKVPSK
jgi:copper chaperone CopZ